MTEIFSGSNPEDEVTGDDMAAIVEQFPLDEQEEIRDLLLGLDVLTEEADELVRDAEEFGNSLRPQGVIHHPYNGPRGGRGL